MNKSTIHPLFSLLAALALTIAALAPTPAHACGGPYRPPSESARASWAVRAHFSEQATTIERVDVTLADASRAVAVVVFKDTSKLPPLHLRLAKKRGQWRVVETKSWHA